MEHTEDWFMTHTEIVAFARSLVASGEFDTEALLGYFEKPWKWSAEHEIWCKAGRPDEISFS